MYHSVFALCITAAALLLTMTLTQAQPAPPASADSAASAAKDRDVRYQKLTREVKTLREGLATKEAELAKLRRKYTTSKGRTPTEEELKEFEKKRAKGDVKVEDNPYVNKSPLSSPGRSREAYYGKLAEIKQDKEKLIRLEQELEALKR